MNLPQFTIGYCEGKSSKGMRLRTGFQNVVMIMLAMMLASCSALDNLQGISQNNGVPSPSAQASLSEPVEVTFHAILPEALPENAGLELDIVDEITGLAINPARYVMEALSDGSYESRVTVPAGSLIRYRYIKVDVTPAIEYTSSGRQVRYRILHAIDKMTVTDSVNAWTDLTTREHSDESKEKSPTVEAVPRLEMSWFL